MSMTHSEYWISRFGLRRAAMVLFAIVGLAPAVGQVDCPLISGGGAILDDGTIIIVGQFAIGTIGGGAMNVRQGAIPCWLGEASIPGDLNCDGAVNNFDVDPFVLALTDTAAWQLVYPGCDVANGDTNGDGIFDNFDIDAFVHLLSGG